MTAYVDVPVVELAGVSKRYGDVLALDEVSLRVESSEVVAILGPNGAGKTTAMSLMIGLRKPMAGSVRLLGMDPGSRRARSQCGVMLQDATVPPNLKVRELVQVFRSYYPTPMPAHRPLELAGLAAKSEKFAGDLSGGERQRLYYALAICGNPKVLFLDEPSAGMDVEGRRSFWTDVRALAQSGVTVVLTTHYLEEADQLAHRIVVLNRGRIVADASPTVIKARVPQRRIRFDTDDLDEVLLRELPVNASVFSDHRVTLLTNEPEETLRGLFQRGVAVRNLEVIGADLEEAFIALTEEGTRADNE